MRVKFSLFICFLFFGIAIGLTGCGGASEKKIEKASELIRDHLVETYNVDFKIEEMNAECAGIFNSVKKYYGYASVAADPTMKFYCEMSADKQSFEDQYLCKLLEGPTEKSLRIALEPKFTDTITTEVYSKDTLLPSETAINGDTVINSTTIGYNVYLIREYNGNSFNVEREASDISDYCSKLNGLSFRGIFRVYYVTPGTVEMVKQGIHGLYDEKKSNASIIKWTESDFEGKKGLSTSEILDMLN